MVLLPSLSVMVHLCLLTTPSSARLASGPAAGTAQILICSHCCVFLPPVSAGGRASMLSFMGTLIVLSYTPETQSLPSRSCGFKLQLVHLVGSFSIVFLSHTAPGFQLCFYLHPCMWTVHRSLLLRLPWGLCVCPQGVLDVEGTQPLGSQGPWQGYGAGMLVASAAGALLLAESFSRLWQLAFEDPLWLVLLCGSTHSGT